MFPQPGGRNNLTSPITTACRLLFQLQWLISLLSITTAYFLLFSFLAITLFATMFPNALSNVT
jgi:hypothetical protein